MPPTMERGAHGSSRAGVACGACRMSRAAGIGRGHVAARCTGLALACAVQPFTASNVAAQNAAPAPPAERPPGILPLEEYTGDFWHRSRLTGDWGGARTDLAAKGVQFGVDWNQVVQSVAAGGRNATTKYGGTLDYNLTLDLDRMRAI